MDRLFTDSYDTWYDHTKSTEVDGETVYEECDPVEMVRAADAEIAELQRALNRLPRPPEDVEDSPAERVELALDTVRGLKNANLQITMARDRRTQRVAAELKLAGFGRAGLFVLALPDATEADPRTERERIAQELFDEFDGRCHGDYEWPAAWAMGIIEWRLCVARKRPSVGVRQSSEADELPEDPDELDPNSPEARLIANEEYPDG
jgi:hypothetical protein